MVSIWYYAHDENKIGPFSPRELKDLADTGTILRSDTIWQDSIEKGVLASRVRNLFPLAKADALKVINPPAVKSATAAVDSPRGHESELRPH
jgi:hypothetical protein